MLDVGGGSTEFIAGEVGEISYGVSLNVGSVRLTERLLESRPPSTVQIRKAEKELMAMLGVIPGGSFAGLPLIESGGTARVLASMIGANEPAPAIAHHVVREWRDRLFAISPDEVRALNPSILTGREDIAATALLILDVAMQHFGFEAFIAGQGGLRHGLALENAES